MLRNGGERKRTLKQDIVHARAEDNVGDGRWRCGKYHGLGRRLAMKSNMKCLTIADLYRYGLSRDQSRFSSSQLAESWSAGQQGLAEIASHVVCTASNSATAPSPEADDVKTRIDNKNIPSLYSVMSVRM